MFFHSNPKGDDRVQVRWGDHSRENRRPPYGHAGLNIPEINVRSCVFFPNTCLKKLPYQVACEITVDPGCKSSFRRNYYYWKLCACPSKKKIFSFLRSFICCNLHWVDIFSLTSLYLQIVNLSFELLKIGIKVHLPIIQQVVWFLLHGGDN